MTATKGVAISSAQGLQNINNNLSGSYYLTQDIDLTGVTFIPIGSGNTLFTGTFHGNRNKVENLTIDSLIGRWQYSYNGLFGQVEGGTIKNVCARPVM